MRLMIISILFCLSFNISAAQDAAKIPPEKRVDILKLMELTGADQIGLQVVGQIKNQIASKLKEEDQKIFDLLIEEVDPSEAMEFMVPIYSQHLTHEDIKQLIIFYQSPLGQKIRTVMPSINQEANQAGQAWGKKIATEVLQKMENK
jgi:uncharacterized protein